ncbi:MAG: intradiol ring-cleavage dioxygenase [Chloroflexota bacterium]
MTDETTPPKRITRRKTLGLFGAAGVAGLAAAVGCSSSDDSASSTAAAAKAASPATAPSGTGAAAATTTAAATATPAATASAAPAVVAVNCVAVPALTEGPYFVDELLNRSDIRSDPSNGAVEAGVPLVMSIKVFDGSCAPLADAHVDIWHCNADGVYSDVGQNNSVGQKFLRGYQATDASGIAKFTTVYPGWYQGRTVHIHFKIRKYDGSSQTAEFTSQFFFDDALSNTIYEQAPYNAHGNRDQTNSSDSIYNESGGATLMTLTPTSDGYETAFGVMMQV